MQLAIVQIAEVGLLHAPLVPESPLCRGFWASFALGALAQWLVLKKARHPWARWSFAAALACRLRRTS